MISICTIPTLKYPFWNNIDVAIAYILIKSDLGAEQKVIEDLQKIPQVMKIDRTFGDYDLVVKLEAEHVEKIREIISWNVKKVEKIRSTLTLLKKE